MTNTSPTHSKKEKQKINPWRVVVKGGLFFILLNLILVLINPPMKSFFLFNNNLFPGYQRLPVLWTPDRHLNNTEFFERSFIDKLDLMLAAHEVSGRKKPSNEYWVFIYGDSSVWGTALYPDETLAGQLNDLKLTTCDGKKLVAFNLGYPSNAALKDLVIMDQTRKYDPDQSVWLFSMLAFTQDRQVVPFIEANPEYAKKIVDVYKLKTDISTLPMLPESILKNTILEKRLDFHLLVNLYASRVITDAIGTDDARTANEREILLKDTPKKTLDFKGIQPTDDLAANLALDTLTAATLITDGKIIYINEPIFVRQPTGDETAYNSAFPVWAYDKYRELVQTMVDKGKWNYADYWNLLPSEDSYSTSLFHLRPVAEQTLALLVGQDLVNYSCKSK